MGVVAVVGVVEGVGWGVGGGGGGWVGLKTCQGSMPIFLSGYALHIPGPPKRSPFSACARKLSQRATLPRKSECTYMFKRRPPLCTLFECRSEIVKRPDCGRCLGIQVCIHVYASLHIYVHTYIYIYIHGIRICYVDISIDANILQTTWGSKAPEPPRPRLRRAPAPGHAGLDLRELGEWLLGLRKSAYDTIVSHAQNTGP